MTGSPEGAELYRRDFYEDQASGSRQSARIILPVVMRLVRPASVVDVGCGIGSWLSVLDEAGVEDVLGIDGDYVDRSLLEIPEDRFLPRDLRLPLKIDRKFDLAISMEVAEHLPPECAEQFVDSLVGLSPAVLFSAAIPHQGGTDHVNERWQGYWADLFDVRGYVCLDPIRGLVWEDERVDWWYRQNTLLFVSAHLLREDAALQQEASVFSRWPRSIVHPEMQELMSARAEAASRRRTLTGRIKESLPDSVKGPLRTGRDRFRAISGGRKRSEPDP